MIIGAGFYRWAQHFERQSIPSTIEQNIDEVLGNVSEAGIESFESLWDSEAKFDLYSRALPKHGLKMASIYVPCNLMRVDIDAEIAVVVQRCLAAKELGTTILVTNPDPVNWNNTPKPDDLIRRQTTALESLGQELRQHGMTLAYHFHTSELLEGAKELHHTMLHTTPENVRLCLDSHWAYRGCGNSHLAIEDLLQLYGDRITSLHIRQSHQGIWTETLTDGDINYKFLFDYLDERSWNGLACIELAIEDGTPFTMDLGQSHRESKAWLETAWPRIQENQWGLA
jgi:inosose dehydratase